MKPHLIIKLSPDAPVLDAPYWGDFIGDRSGAVEQIEGEVDQVMRRHGLAYWVTREYRPVSGVTGHNNWSKEEIQSGLNRIYRLVMQANNRIPDSLIQEIRLVPFVEKAYTGMVGVADMPEQVSVAQGIVTARPSEQIFLHEAHLFSKGDPTVKIAVLDTGIDATHPEIKHAIDPGMDFVDILDGAEKFIGDYLGEDTDTSDAVGHGTHVCGIICAKGVAMPEGVVPHCRIIPVRVLGAMNSGGKTVGAGLIDNISAGIKWAVDQGAQIINMSLGVKHTGGGLPHKEVIEYALRKGVTVVAASGNDGLNDKYYPGALKGVVAVGAVDHTNAITGFSTYGSHISVVAPGYQVYSAGLGHGYLYASGTSQASPFVAGGLALLRSYALKIGRKATDGQLKYLLKMTADRHHHGFKDIRYGFGRINLLDAAKLLRHTFSQH